MNETQQFVELHLSNKRRDMPCACGKMLRNNTTDYTEPVTAILDEDCCVRRTHHTRCNVCGHKEKLSCMVFLRPEQMKEFKE